MGPMMINGKAEEIRVNLDVLSTEKDPKAVGYIMKNNNSAQHKINNPIAACLLRFHTPIPNIKKGTINIIYL